MKRTRRFKQEPNLLIAYLVGKALNIHLECILVEKGNHVREKLPSSYLDFSQGKKRKKRKCRE